MKYLLSLLMLFVGAITCAQNIKLDTPTQVYTKLDTTVLIFNRRDYANAIIYQNSEKRVSLVYDELGREFIYRNYEQGQVTETRFYADKCNLAKMYLIDVGERVGANTVGLKVLLFYDNRNGLAMHEEVMRKGHHQ